ncbi:MAG TPA: PhnD/SsuA/transferrin family substrate-binding protein, partial [bacterium]|nr:PhnD/SsuA/transferrin family substrate-binding protein [bacterium]
LSMQPISNFDNISRLLLDNGVEYLIMPPLFADYINGGAEIKRRLEAVDKYGSNFYSKYILIKKDSGIKTVGELANKLIASSSYGKISEEILNKFIFSGSPLKTENVDILWVKKDLDGIFALVFGQVEAAIVAPASYELLSREKPEFSNELTIVYTSGKIFFPCLYSKNKILNSIDGEIRESFIKMNENSIGMELLKIFGIEKWKQL